MQIERALLNVETLGPGNRFVIWVNGCNRKCLGCVSERLQAFAPENECEIISFLSQFDLSQVDGVTISGGEPFEQAAELMRAVEYLRCQKIEDILIYTGYTYEELKNKNDDAINYILENIAVLIDGPYIVALDNNIGNLKGSSNQRTIFINEKFNNKYSSYYKEARSVQEFQICNVLIGVGIPDSTYISKFDDQNKRGENDGK